MSDRTLIDKIKEALIMAKQQIESDAEDIESEWGSCRSLEKLIDNGNMPEAWGKINDAIADLEKPEEDANKCAEYLYNLEYPTTPNGWILSASNIIKHFAESYHAKECAKCKALPEYDVLERK